MTLLILMAKNGLGLSILTMFNFEIDHIMVESLQILPLVISQHAEEAAFNWLLRDAAVREPHYSLNDLAKLDKRVEAHLDGLRIAGDEGWEICKQELKWEEAGEVFTAAFLAFESDDALRIHEVLEIGGAEPELCRGVISALGWLPFEQSVKYTAQFQTAEAASLRYIGLAAHAIHRQDQGQALMEALRSEDTLLKARALKAVGELGRRDLAAYLQASFRDEDSKCRFYAALSAALLGDAYACPILQTIAQSDSPYCEEATKIALRRLHPKTAQDWLKELAQSPEHLRQAIIGAGALGDPAIIPWLFEMMHAPEHARVAGEAFTMITGVDLAYEDLEGEWPEGFAAGPTENPEDEDVAMDPDEDLPWPAPELIQKWWASNKENFQNGARYLVGKSIAPESLQQVLRSGFQRQRAAAALELAMRQSGRPLFEVREPGFRQQKILALHAS